MTERRFERCKCGILEMSMCRPYQGEGSDILGFVNIPCNGGNGLSPHTSSLALPRSRVAAERHGA